jgi:hypothetical protein
MLYVQLAINGITRGHGPKSEIPRLIKVLNLAQILRIFLLPNGNLQIGQFCNRFCLIHGKKMGNKDIAFLTESFYDYVFSPVIILHKSTLDAINFFAWPNQKSKQIQSIIKII